MRAVLLSFIPMVFFAFLGKSSDSLFSKGLDEMMQEDYQQAQTDFQIAAFSKPCFSSYYNLGVASGKLEEWSKAKWAFESALKFKPLNGDAQFNAEFSTRKLSENQTWNHPYPWAERVVLGFGINTWLIFVILSSIFLGFLVFNIVSKSKGKSTLKKWCISLIGPAIFLFFVSFYGIYSTNNHFTNNRFAIIKNSKTEFYISPNGVEVQDEIDPGSRLNIQKYFKDSTWVQVKSQENNLLWIKNNELYTY
jgi:hypothetical protein